MEKITERLCAVKINLVTRKYPSEGYEKKNLENNYLCRAHSNSILIFLQVKGKHFYKHFVETNIKRWAKVK